MPVIEYGGVKIKLDEEGYLVNFDDWSEKTACGLAENEGIEELSKDRLEIIKFMREYYTKFKAFPILGAVCKNVHKPGDCVNETFMDPLKAWKIAGLPKPSEEVISYLQR
ncbi:MAG: TusE/DsrC/DsvC family sulfur relay protein [Nitrospirae bacterium]|nr:TusE/DsrC/DsvC family sulfur relay protein [Nitrospirota bacterium]MBI4847252.1 TusE/DsrC/DsvC family sulfur relay protein [Nitrospirota bacterium]